MISISERIPGAAKQFNEELLQVLTFNFFHAKQLVSWLFGKEAALKATGLDSAGYYSESPLHNLGSLFVFMVLLPVLHLTLMLAKLIT